MFSRALMWDSSSCGAKSRAEHGVGGGPKGLSYPRQGPPAQTPNPEWQQASQHPALPSAPAHSRSAWTRPSGTP